MILTIAMYYVLCKHSLFKGATETVVTDQRGNKIITSRVKINMTVLSV